MNDNAQEWLAKAAKDLESADRELSYGSSAYFDLICFLCQQGIEKLMKGILVSRQVTPP